MGSARDPDEPGRCGRAGAAAAAHARGLRAHGRARQPGRARARLRGRRRAVALAVRHAAGRLRRGPSGCGRRSSRSTRTCTATCAARLNEKYGDEVQPATGPIRADLLGNMWAQEWGNIYDIVAPQGAAASATTSTDAARRPRATTPREMVKTGESFFTSLGLHAAAGDLLGALDVHEAARPRRGLPRQRLGRRRRRRPAHQDVHRRSTTRTSSPSTTSSATTIYQRAYNKQPFLFQDGANDGFHEAIGDTSRSRVTPAYLQADRAARQRAAGRRRRTSRLLMKRALEKVAFLPFGLLIDKWRWDVFAGKTTPRPTTTRPGGSCARSTRASRRRARAPAGRLRSRREVPHPRQRAVHALLPRAASPVPVPPRAAARPAGRGPAPPLLDLRQQGGGQRSFEAMLELGARKPWPEALDALTGEREMDATALIEYFAPLTRWLERAEQGRDLRLVGCENCQCRAETNRSRSA